MDQPIKEAIILAGGLGTRLKDAIGDIPKPLAPVNEQPFLHYVFNYLKDHQIEAVVLSVGYKLKMIKKVFGEEYLGIKIKYSVEEEPLGTGGAIGFALNKINSDQCFVLNGDTFFDIDLQALGQFHLSHGSECSLAAKSLKDFDRYGTIEITEDTVQAFNEKMPKQNGIINGGIYCLNKSIRDAFPDADRFSFETEYLEPNASTGKIKAMIFDNYFIDIGVPEDYKQFEIDTSSQEKERDPEALEGTLSLRDLKIDKTWTLFLDRDGVINERLIDDYVKQINELSIIDGVPEAVAQFTKQFGRVLVVTNQQGIGKGMMTADDLELIHGYMNNVFENHGGKIDQFYFAPQLASEGSNYRKPGTGMGLQAKKDYPEIDFSKSIMIGDTESDIKFGMNLGMITVMLTNVRNISTEADYIFNNLQTVARELK